MKVYSLIRIVSDLKIEELIIWIVAIPRRQFYNIGALLGIQFDLGLLTRIFPSPQVNIEVCQDSDWDQCAIQSQFRVFRQTVQRSDRNWNACISYQLRNRNILQLREGLFWLGFYA